MKGNEEDSARIGASSKWHDLKLKNGKSYHSSGRLLFDSTVVKWGTLCYCIIL